MREYAYELDGTGTGRRRRSRTTIASAVSAPFARPSRPSRDSTTIGSDQCGATHAGCTCTDAHRVVRRNVDRLLCQNCVTYPLKPWANTAIYGDTPMHIDVA